MRAAVFAMSDANHFWRTHTVTRALAEAGVEVRVYSDRRFARGCGGLWRDARRRLHAATRSSAPTPTSRPLPVRNVTWAGRFGKALIAQVETFAPDLVVYDSYAVIGPAWSVRRSACPTSASSPATTSIPARLVPAMAHDARVAISDSCRAALAVLADPPRLGRRLAVLLGTTRSAPHLNLGLPAAVHS